MPDKEKKGEQGDAVPRLYVYPIDIMRMRGCSRENAEQLYYRIKRKLKKPRGAELTYQEYCFYVDVQEKYILPYLKLPPYVIIGLLALSMLSFTKLAVNKIPALKKYFEDHHVFWLETKPGYQRGEMEMKDSKTGKVETMTIEVEENR